MREGEQPVEILHLAIINHLLLGNTGLNFQYSTLRTRECFPPARVAEQADAGNAGKYLCFPALAAVLKPLQSQEDPV